MEGSKSKNKGRAFTYCLASRSCNGLVHVRRQKGTVEVTDNLFKNYLIQKLPPYDIFWPHPGLGVYINMARGSVLWWIKGISGHLKTQEMYNAVVLIEPYSLAFVHDRFKTKGMCNDAVHREAYTLGHVLDHLHHFRIITMMMNSLSGMIGVKNARPKKQK